MSKDIIKPALDFTLGTSDFMKRVSGPLLECFGLKCFGYFRLYNDCSYLIMMNGYEDYNRKYFHEIDKEDPYYIEDLRNTPPGGPHYYIWPQSFDVMHPNASLNFEFNIWNGFNISYRREDYVEVFWFAFGREGCDVAAFFIKNLHCLTEFCENFQSQSYDLLKSDINKKITRYKEPFDFSYVPNQKIIKLMEGFDKKIIIESKGKQPIKLSSRESECLKRLSESKTIKEIARDLNLSNRTVEYYLNNIKSKLGLNYSRDIINLYTKRIKCGA